LPEFDLSVVVPVYNNAATLPALMERLAAVVDATGLCAELIFVDDGSTDASAALVAARAESDSRFVLLGLAANFGGQAALCAGFDAVRGRRAVCLDADLENLPEDIPALLAALDQGHDLACGVRQGRTRSWRSWASSLLNAYARSRLAHPVKDLGCGMRAMDSRVIDDLASAGRKRCLLTPLLLERASSVVEVPVRWVRSTDSGGHSFLSLLGMAFDYFMLTAGRPFLVVGAVATVAAVGGTVAVLGGLHAGRSALALAGIFLASTGALGMAIALIGEYAQRGYRRGDSEPLYRLRDADGDQRGRPAGSN